MLNPDRSKELESPHIITMRFELAGGIALEIFIGVGLFWYGAVIGGNFESLGQLVTRVSEFAHWSIGLQIAFLILVTIAIGLAIMTSYSSLMLLFVLMVNRIVMDCDNETFPGSFCKSRKCGCGLPVNYVGNPCIPITRAIVTLLDPLVGMTFGTALAAHKAAMFHLIACVTIFAAIHLIVIFLRTNEMRRLIKQDLAS
jgi:hypothetical protein